jgi:hypothetical protein
MLAGRMALFRAAFLAAACSQCVGGLKTALGNVDLLFLFFVGALKTALKYNTEPNENSVGRFGHVLAFSNVLQNPSSNREFALFCVGRAQGVTEPNEQASAGLGGIIEHAWRDSK